MGTKVEMIGKRIGRYKVLRGAGSNKHGKYGYWCLCDCGNVRPVVGASLRRGLTQSCGCFSRERKAERSTTHGLNSHELYRTWANMLDRCRNSNSRDYYLYGGRGIKVCERWEAVENFIADMGKRPEGHTLDRIDNYGDYTPENCRWASATEQNRNTRSNRLMTLNGKTQCATAWAEELNMKPQIIFKRLYLGWSDEEALTTPVGEKRK